MRLVAQRVVKVGSKPLRTGINAFCYLHPGQTWLEPPDEIGAGELRNKDWDMPPGGNRIRSYLDILCPDNTSNTEISATVRDGALLLGDRPKPQAFPWAIDTRAIRFEFGVDGELAHVWREELVTLLTRALGVRVVDTGAGGILGGNIFDPWRSR